MAEPTACCPAMYVCPSSGEDECLTHGGFDCCCADRSCPGWRRLPWWRWLRPRVLKSLAVMAGYWVRPFDMVADRRRWFWQPRAQCGFAWARANPEAAQRIADAIGEDEWVEYGSPPQGRPTPRDPDAPWSDGQPRGYA